MLIMMLYSIFMTSIHYYHQVTDQREIQIEIDSDNYDESREQSYDHSVEVDNNSELQIELNQNILAQNN